MKIKLKLLLFSMMFIGLGLSFCSAGNYTQNGNVKRNSSTLYSTTVLYLIQSHFSSPGSFDWSCTFSNFDGTLSFSSLSFRNFYSYFNGSNSTTNSSSLFTISNDSVINSLTITGSSSVYDVPGYLALTNNGQSNTAFSFDFSCTFSGDNIVGGTSSIPSSIDVLYNNENSTTNITCNGDNVIQIDGLSTITATNKFTPYFNIDYRDEDNQLLTESYSKDILYLSGTLFKKTFTGDNERILTSQGNNNDYSFSGYTPTFDIVFTGDTREDTGNVFNNFTQNSLQVLLSNIPSYIQYVIIIMLLFFILGLARRKNRR